MGGWTCASIGDVASDVVPDLQPHAHVKVLADVALAPVLELPVLGVHKCALLHSTPPQKRIVAH